MAIVKDATYPRYWSVNGTPTLLLGGSDQDNLFQFPTGLDPGGTLAGHLDALVDAGGNYIRLNLAMRETSHGTDAYAWDWNGSNYDLDTFNTNYFDRLNTCLSLCEARGIVAQVELFDGFDWYDTEWDNHPMNPDNNINYTGSTGAPTTGNWTQTPSTGWNPVLQTVYSTSLSGWATLKGYLDAFINEVLDVTLAYPNTVLYCDANEHSEPVAYTEYWADFIRSRATTAGVTVSIGSMTDQRPQDHATYNTDWYNLVDATLDYHDISQASHNDADADANEAEEPSVWYQVIGVLADTTTPARPLNFTKIYHPALSRSFSQDNNGRKMAYRTFPRVIFAGAASARFHRATVDEIGLAPQCIARIKAVRAADNLFGFIGSDEDGALISGASTEVRCRSRADKVAVLFIDDGSCTVDLTGHGSVDTISWYNTDSGLLHTQEAVAGGGSPTITTPTAGVDADWIGIITLGGVTAEEWLDGWSYRFPITSDNTLVDEAVTNVLFDLADAPAAFWSNVKSDGSDIRITRADGSSELAREVLWRDVWWDDFKTYDAGKWSDTYFSVTAPTIGIVSEQLSITVDDTGDTYGDAYVTHIQLVDLVARGHMAIECVSAPSPPTGTISWLLKIDDDNFVGFVLETDGTIRARENVATVTSDVASATYSNATHRWWRMREAAGTLYWEVSTDGASWNTFHSKAAPITLTSLLVSIYHWTDTGVETSVWDNAGHGLEEGLVFLNSPDLSTSADTDYYVYYGNAAATEPAAAATYGRQNAWDSTYEYVLHGHNTTLLDSTGNHSPTLPGGTPSIVPFGVHKGLRFSAAASDQVEVTGMTAMINPISIEAICRAATGGGTTDSLNVISKWNNIGMAWGHSSTQNWNHILSADAGTIRATLGTLSASTTYWLGGSLNDSDLIAYKDGTQSGTDTVGTLDGTGTSTMTIGDIWNGSNFQRDIAEVRISNVFRSANYYSTQYNVQSDPTTFWTVGAEESPPAATISRQNADIANQYQTDTECHVSIDTVDAGATTHKLYGHTSDLGSIASWEATGTVVDADVAAAEIIAWTGRTPNTNYYFVVITDSTEISETLTIKTAYAAPTGATLVDNTLTSVTVSWTDQSGGVAKHVVFYRASVDPLSSLVTAGIIDAGATLEFEFTGLTEGTEYSFEAVSWDNVAVEASGRFSNLVAITDTPSATAGSGTSVITDGIVFSDTAGGLAVLPRGEYRHVSTTVILDDAIVLTVFMD